MQGSRTMVITLACHCHLAEALVSAARLGAGLGLQAQPTGAS